MNNEDQIIVPYDWLPRDYQLPAWQFFENGGRRGAAVWHRRAGKDLFAVNLIASKAVQRVGLYWHLFPTYSQGRKIAWEGSTRDGRKFKSHIPDILTARENNTEMLKELKNGSIYQVVGCDNIDRLVGSNPVGCVFSEWSLMDPRVWEYIRPILVENDGFAFFIYTPRGHNHGYTLYQNAKKLDSWFSEILTVRDTRAVTPEAIEEERLAGMPEELIEQEFYCSFDAPMHGAYYGNLMAKAYEDGRITKVPWEPYLDVHTAWDLGIGDQMSIWFYQKHGFEYRIIDYYEAHGEGLPHYIKVLKERDYVYGQHFAPHDIKVRDLSTGYTRLQTARELGVNFTALPKLPVDEGIEAVRTILPQCYFDEDKTEHGIECLRQYQKKYDEVRKVFLNKPDHDWTSHAADAFRILALSITRLRENRKKIELPTHAIRAEGL